VNYIQIVLDSFRQDHLGCYGNEQIHTPYLDAFARESILFERARSESLPTIPCRRALCTGKRIFPWDDRERPKGLYNRHKGWLPLREDDVTVAEQLSEQGYVTAMIADTYHMFKPTMNFHRGFDAFEFIRGQEFDRWKSHPLPPGALDRYTWPGTPERRLAVLKQWVQNQSDRRAEEDYQPARVFRAAIDWLERNAGHEKFFLWVDSFDPHEPWDPPKHYVDLYDRGYEGLEFIYPSGPIKGRMTEAEYNHVRALYAGEVTMVDHWCGQLLEAIDRLGLRENTLVLILSDHGKIIGEFGSFGMSPAHTGPKLYDVPYLLRHPEGIGAGTRVPHFVYNIDLIATVFGLLDAEPMPGLQGQDLWPMLTQGAPPVRDYAVTAYNLWDATWHQDWLYLRNTEENFEALYDLAADPERENDVAGDYPDVRRDLAERLDAVAAGAAV